MTQTIELEDIGEVMESSDGMEDFLTDFFGDKSLRWYQRAAINQGAQALEDGIRRILIKLPTGAGKTLCIAAAMSDPQIRRALKIPASRPIRVLFVAHKHRLLSQAENTFIDDSNVTLILQSMFSAIPDYVLQQGWDICILDEAHHEACSTFQYQLERIGDQVIIGLTATDSRADGCLIKFDEIIEPISREQAVHEGWLAPTRIHSFVDVTSKDKINILTDVFTNYAHEMNQTMVFVKTKKEVVAVTILLRSLGYKVVGLLAQSEKELNNILDRFSAGEIQFIVNCNRISEGVDVIGCTDVVLGRQFGSYAQLNQVIGRAARPDSDCNVWELVNPLSGTNLDTTTIVGTPEYHRLVNKQGPNWIERIFDYVTHRTNKQLGIASGIRISHQH